MDAATEGRFMCAEMVQYYDGIYSFKGLQPKAKD